MKKLLLFSMLAGLTATSCQKVIELDIQESDLQYVLESEMTEGGPKVVALKISQTAPFLSGDEPKRVENASVVLYDDQGNSLPLVHRDSGIYQTTYEALPDHTYRLQVDFGGEQYLAESFLPAHSELLGARAEPQDSSGIFIGYQIKFSYQDPANRDDYYRLRMTVNGKVQNSERADAIFFNDQSNNGLTVTRTIRNKTFQSGDEVKLELLSMTKENFRYQREVFDMAFVSAASNFSAAAPGNPINNWTGPVVGNFTTYGLDELTYVVP
ncbi:DUF4249 domain-containing protein [bacterium SCSIO 12741]|nr:DUF4249 domain-containing protein [bacterium SCSIO 12741]